jgi:hypothetical protein
VSTPTCPNCRSSRVESNKGHDHSGSRAAHAAHVTKSLGANPAVALAVALGTWLAGKVCHSATSTWKCRACGHSFS